METYVSVIFESKWDNWSMPGDYDYDENNYDDRVIGIFDSHDYAEERLCDWRKNMAKLDNYLGESVYHDRTMISLKPREEPNGFEHDECKCDFKYELTYMRKIVTMPLRCRES